MEVINLVEHEDGSATLSLVMTDKEQLALLRLGIITAIKAGIEEAKQYEPGEEYGTETTTE